MTLLHMSPLATMHDVSDGRICDTHTPGDFGLGDPLRVESSDFPHLGFGEFGPTVPLPASTSLGMGVSALPLATCLSALGNTVSPVIHIRAGEQMPWVTAWRTVAIMEHVQTGRDGSFDQFIGEAMSLDSRFMGNTEPTISPLGSVGQPGPALIRAANVHLFPEAFAQGSAFVGSSHVSPFQKGDPLSLAVLVEGTRCGALGVMYEKSANHIGSLDGGMVTQVGSGVK